MYELNTTFVPFHSNVNKGRAYLKIINKLQKRKHNS